MEQLQNSRLAKYGTSTKKKTCRLGWAPSALPAMHGARLWERWEGSFVVLFSYRNIQVGMIWMSFSLRRAVYLGDQSHLDYFLKEGKWVQRRVQNGYDEYCETCSIHPNCDQYMAEANKHHKIDPHDCVCARSVITAWFLILPNTGWSLMTVNCNFFWRTQKF